MDGKPANAEPSQSPESSERNGDHGQGEQFGSVELERRVKDDGRALLVFRRPPAR